MYRLPLFPLNTVLFPKMSLSLHIFEERYKMMIRRCIDEKQPFGVVLIESGSEVKGFGENAIPYTVGCTASITQVQQLAMGRMNITAVGDQRFVVHHLEFDEPYLVGQVENLPLTIRSNILQTNVSGRLRVWLEKYLAALERTELVRFDRAQLPSSDEELAYLAAAILKISTEEKQVLLAENDLFVLLGSLRKIYQKEVTILDFMLSSPERNETLPFSLN